jgi:hypothetical protein
MNFRKSTILQILVLMLVASCTSAKTGKRTAVLAASTPVPEADATPPPEDEPETAIESIVTDKSGTSLTLTLNSSQWDGDTEVAIVVTFGGSSDLRKMWVNFDGTLSSTEVWGTKTQYAGLPQLVVSGLFPGVAYSFSVEMRIGSGAAADATASDAVVAVASKPFAPEMVTSVTMTVPAVNPTTSITLTWVPSGSDSKAFRIAYSTVVPPQSCEPATDVLIVNETQVRDSTTYTLTGLDDSGDYYFGVCSLNDAVPPDASMPYVIAGTLNDAGSFLDYTALGSGGDLNGMQVIDGQFLAGDVDRFGYAVDASQWSVGTAVKAAVVVGAPYHDFNPANALQVADAGAAYVYYLDSSTFGLITKVAGINGMSGVERNANDHFGFAVATSRKWVAVGSPGQDYDAAAGNQLADAGAVYIFVSNQVVDAAPTAWTFHAKIVPPNRQAGADFGYALDFEDSTQDRLIVGAPGEDSDRGAVFYFKRDGGNVWNYVQKISGENAGDRFGSAVSHDASKFVVGAPKQDYDTIGTGGTYAEDAGAAYVYTFNGGSSNYDRTTKIYAQAGAYGNGRNAFDSFGSAVHTTPNYLAVGAPHQDYHEGGFSRVENAGACYVYTSAGTLVQKLTAYDVMRKANAEFGRAVALGEGDGSSLDAYCSAWNQAPDRDNGNDVADAGAIFLYNLKTGQADFSLSYIFTAVTRNVGDHFGSDVHVGGRVKIFGIASDNSAGRVQAKCGVIGGASAGSAGWILLVPIIVIFGVVFFRRKHGVSRPER